MPQKKTAVKEFQDSRRPGRLLTLQSVALPADAIADRFISAGWLLAHMDLAGGKRADDYIGGRAVTIAVDSMSFKKPVFIGDQVAFYTEIVRQGRTSLTLKVESWAHRRVSKKAELVTEGYFTFVAIGKDRRPALIRRPALKQKWQGKPKAVNGQDGAIVRADQNLSMRMVPLPRDTNYLGDIFGGWILAHMDLACIKAAQKATGRVVATVGLEAMTFHKPVRVGDEVSFYTRVLKTGKTSITIKVETWALAVGSKNSEKVTEGSFTYVAIDENRKPVLLGKKR